MEILGYALFVIMGLTLGVIGAGGSILTIPILLYVFEVPIMLATAYSLFIVGFAALFGVARYKDYIDFRKASIFAIPSLIGIFLSRHYLLPHLPATILGLSRDILMVNMLAVFMFLAAYFMLQPRDYEKIDQDPFLSTYIKIIFIACALGMIMGIIGAGGGFLIIPVLVVILGVGIKKAIPTSLLIVAINSIVGFASDRQLIDLTVYKQLFSFVLLSLVGMWIGTKISPKLSSDKLKKIFGWFIGALATFMLIKSNFF